MAFKPGDRVQLPDGKTGTVVSETRRCDPAWGDPFTGVGVEVQPDEVMPGYGVALVHVQVLSRLDKPEAVVIVELDDDELLEEVARLDPLRGAEPVERAAHRLQKQIIHIVERAAELDPSFRSSRVTVGEAVEIVKAAGEVVGMRVYPLEQLRDMKVNLLVDTKDPE